MTSLARLVQEPETLERISGGRISAGASPFQCDRVWPSHKGHWLARATSVGSGETEHWGLFKPDGTWPRRLAKLHADGRCLWLLDIETLAWRIADDPAIPSLQSGPLDFFPSRADASKLIAGAGRIVGYKPLRRVVSRFVDAGGTPTAYVKLLPRGQAARLAERHSLLESWAAHHGHFRTPHLKAFRIDPDILVWRPVDGRCIADALAPARADRFETAARVGRAIASLHLGPPHGVRRHDRQAELATLAGWANLGRALLPSPTGLARALARVQALAATLPAAPLVLSHRDLHDGQLIDDGEAITILDADTLALAEPELDLGNLLAHFDLLAFEQGEQDDLGDLDEQQWHGFQQALVAAYAELTQGAPDLDRLGWYRAASCLRMACVHAGRPASRAHAPRLVRRAHSLLESIDPVHLELCK